MNVHSFRRAYHPPMLIRDLWALPGCLQEGRISIHSSRQALTCSRLCGGPFQPSLERVDETSTCLGKPKAPPCLSVLWAFPGHFWEGWMNFHSFWRALTITPHLDCVLALLSYFCEGWIESPLALASPTTSEACVWPFPAPLERVYLISSCFASQHMR